MKIVTEHALKAGDAVVVCGDGLGRRGGDVAAVREDGRVDVRMHAFDAKKDADWAALKLADVVLPGVLLVDRDGGGVTFGQRSEVRDTAGNRVGRFVAEVADSGSKV